MPSMSAEMSQPAQQDSAISLQVDRLYSLGEQMAEAVAILDKHLTRVLTPFQSTPASDSTLAGIREPGSELSEQLRDRADSFDAALDRLRFITGRIDL